jgi:hypothetical protein
VTIVSNLDIFFILKKYTIDIRRSLRALKNLVKRLDVEYVLKIIFGKMSFSINYIIGKLKSDKL